MAVSSGVAGLERQGAGVVDGAAFAHQGVDLVHGGLVAVDGVEDLLDRGQVAVIGGGAGGGAEIDDGVGGKLGGEEESGESEELLGAERKGKQSFSYSAVERPRRVVTRGGERFGKWFPALRAAAAPKPCLRRYHALPRVNGR